MKGTVRDWLPAEALCGARVRAALDAQLSAWSARWFTRKTIVSGAIEPANEGARPPRGGGQWRLFVDGVGVHCSPIGAARLLDWALDTHSDQEDRAELDQILLDRFLEAMLMDLAGEIAKTKLGGSSQISADPLSGGRGVVVSLVHGEGVELARLALAEAIVMPLAKVRREDQPARPANLTALARALAAETVVTDVSLGVAELEFSQLSTLAVGDVVVLSRSLSDPVELCLADQDAVVAKAVLREQDADLFLSLQA